MKKLKLTFALAVVASGTFAQQVADFDNLVLSPNSYNDGSTGSGAFTSGNILFHNTYNFYWDSGFAYSNQGDTTTAPSDYMTQLYETKAGTDHSAAATHNFALGQQGSRVTFVAPARGPQGLYVTNTTYAYNSMALGDSFGKKFGDSATATSHSAVDVNEGYPDWFKLSIIGYHAGVVSADTVNFYLADFRFTDNLQDYIVKDWQYVDLTPLGDADSLDFLLSSSDNGAFGMNTPGYYCIDDFMTNDYVTGVAELKKESGVNVYPNPFSTTTSLDFKTAGERVVNIYNAFGQLLSGRKTNDTKAELNFDGYDSGIYFVNVIENGKSSTIRVIKK